MRSGAELLLKAASLAASAHLAQRRKGLPEPYINHPLRVAVAAEECGLSNEAIAAALLHDVIEDTSITMKDLEQCGFPPRTLTIVQLLSKWWDNSRSEKELTVEAFKVHCERVRSEFKPAYYQRIAEDHDAVVIKLLDRADNLMDMVKVVHEKRPWATSYLRKTAAEFGPVLLANRNPQAIIRYNAALGMLSRALAGVTLG